MDREKRDHAVTDRSEQNRQDTEAGSFRSPGVAGRPERFRPGGALCGCENRSYGILEASADGIALLDLSGRILKMNESAGRLLGFSSPEEAVSSSASAFDFIVPEERDRVIAEFARTVQEGIVRGVRLRIRRRDGSPFEAEMSGAVQRDPTGRPNGVVLVFRDCTDRARAESALVESEETYRSIFQSANDAIFVHDASTGEILDVNEKTTELFGWTVDEIRARPIVDLSSGELPYTQEEAEKKVRATAAGAPQIFEWRSKKKDGTLFWAEVNLKHAMIRGKPRVLALVRDVTERKRTEEEVRKLKTLVDNANFGVAIADLEGFIHYVNDCWAAAHGYTAEELIGENLRIFHADEDLPRVRELNDRLRELGEFSIEEVGHVRRDGTRFPTLMNGVLIRDPESKPLFFGATAIDITDRKRAEEERQRTERLLKDFMDHSPTFFWAKDVRGRFTMANRAVADLFHRASKEVVGLTTRDLFPTNPKLVAEMDEKDLRVMETGETLSLEKSVLLGETARRFLIWKFPLRDAEGTLAGIGAAGVDVTEQRELEERLRQSQKMEAIGTLAGGIAHDFNNIIYSILGFTELAMDHTEKGSKPHRCLEQVREAGARASDLVAQILEFSRRRETERTPLRLQRMIPEALRLAEGSRPPRVEVRTALDPNCGEVLADPTEIHQVLLNLVANAFHAMREQAGTLAIRLEEFSTDGGKDPRGTSLAPGRYARLAVEDTGHGMDSSTARRIFEPYFTTKPVGEGTGLGLATVHGIVRAMGGAIFVESEPGRGTRFDVYLPLVPAAPARDRETTNDKKEAERGAHTGRR
jgi:PAS domain S-box-containing protein